VTGSGEAMSDLAYVISNSSLEPTEVARCAHPSWFAIRTWPRYEKKVATEFQRKDIEVFLPLLSSKRQWSDRRQVVQLPLFPSYVFVRIAQEPSTRVPVLCTHGVTSFVGSRGVGTPIPDTQIDAVRTILTGGVLVEPHPFLLIGQKVRVRGGSLDGLEGLLLAKNGDLSVVISVPAIQRSLSIRVTGYTVEPA
jgi:transcription antitermination factor NusG